MADENQDDAASPQGSPRKRTPPTIDLTAASVSDSSTASGEASAAPSDAKPRKSWRERFGAVRAAFVPPFRRSIASSPKPSKAAARVSIRPILIAGLVGAVVAFAGAGGIWYAMSSGEPGRILARLPMSTAKSDSETTVKRAAKAESRTSNATAASADNALVARIDALEKSVASLREDIASARGALDELKATVASQADTSATDERISKIERATVALTGEMAAPQKATTDDPRLRRVAIAASLDAAVNRGEPYTVALSAAKSAAEDASILKPLDEFADKGIPSASSLNRELIGLLPQILPKKSSSAPSGWIDRLQQSALRLFRIRRADEDEISGIASRAASAARRDDLASARKEIEALSGGDRAPLSSWIEKVDAREAALAASRQFASAAASALPRSVQ